MTSIFLIKVRIIESVYITNSLHHKKRDDEKVFGHFIRDEICRRITGVMGKDPLRVSSDVVAQQLSVLLGKLTAAG